MVGNSFVDDLDCGSFFDHIDDLLDFPVEDVDAGLPPAKGGDSGNSFPTIWSTQSEALPGSDSVFSANRNSDLSADLSVPYEDIVQLEWLSNFVEDSFCGGGSLATMSKEEPKDLTHTQFQTSSPVSVLESSSSCSSDKSLPRSPEPTIATPAQQRGRARSKRPRPATFCPRPPIQLISPASSVSETTHDHHHQVLQVIAPKTTSDSDNFAESRPLNKMPKHGALGMQKKNKKIKLSFSLAPLDGVASQNSPSQSMRKCMHCEITKTPQWRAGPMGPKTLCNACGVRYKSGRLFPEYRPAASPTFVPSLHSNSHKKVLEMRNKTDEKTAANVITITVQPELIPNTNSAISMDYM
ncbi:GATA transcription factor 8-like [Cucurbita pepo subsp. pepo]|uniref:GATA transcription factor 8-like n=1 Tax=Cucurbita pepo subsp. pepo TaxID=3664 RepID=UPI000C9D3F9D|nr:GATA transcription factor 8-like [Cucurbita pepo subsp. pepo]